MVIDKKIQDEFTAKAKESPRLRCNMDLRNSPDDQSQRMLNALEPGTVMPIHRHLASSETVVIIRGRIRWHFYDEQGRITESTELWSDGDVRMLNVEKGRWHSLECLESGSVLFESKDGPYHPLEEDEVLTFPSKNEDKEYGHEKFIQRHRPVFSLPFSHARRRQQAPRRAAGI